MPTTLTALFATALHEARVAAGEPLGIQRAAGLLVTAAGARRIEWRFEDGDLIVNGLPLRADAPGVPHLVQAFREHLTRRLALPAGLWASQWVDLANLYAAAPGLYPTAEHMRAAILDIIPGAAFDHSADRIDADAQVLEAGGPMGLSSFTDVMRGGEPSLVSPGTDRSALSARIGPLIDAARAASARADWLRVAELLVELDQVAQEGDSATEAIVSRERQRLMPITAIEHLVGELSSAGASSVVMQALATLGRDGADAIFELLAREPSRARHRLYLQVLEAIRGGDEAIIGALGSEQDAVARDAATVVGRRRMERAVPVLGALLRHHAEEVRTSAWRALEDIGNAEAMALIR